MEVSINRVVHLVGRGGYQHGFGGGVAAIAEHLVVHVLKHGEDLLLLLLGFLDGQFSHLFNVLVLQSFDDFGWASWSVFAVVEVGASRDEDKAK